MDYEKKSRSIANSYYNLGLERGEIRDLTGAVDCLKKSLHCNKYHTDARNLLGLIYYEIGEVAEALTQWVISLNLQPEKNRAEYFLKMIQEKSGYLEIDSQNLKKYNQALLYAQTGNEDLAVLQLTRVVEETPNFIKAGLLLALLYMNREDFTKAGKNLFRVLKVDKNHPKALWYMSIVKENTGKAEVEKRKLKHAFSHRQMQDDDIIIPPSYKENTGWQSIANICAGLLLGAMVIFFLVMPAKTQALNTKHNSDLIEYSERMNLKNQEIDKLTIERKQMEEEKNEAIENLNTLVSDNGGLLSQYQTLIGVLQAYRKDDFVTAVKLYATLNASGIVDESVQAIISDISADMSANGYQVLAQLGDEARNVGNYAEAIDYYQKSLNLRSDNAPVTLSMAMAYKGLEDTDNANRLFGEIIMNSSDEELVTRAKEERGY